MAEQSYIAIEGPIGAGKTSLAKMLAEDLQAYLVLESPDRNPFLADFYNQPERYALAAQLHFLESRQRQQNDIAKRPGNVISDFSFIKDQVFASLNLAGEEWELFQRFAAHFAESRPKPDLIIYLQSDPALLQKHVKQRKKDYERHISLDYLEDVLEAYNQFFFAYTATPVLIVNCSQIDFVNNPDHYRALVGEVFNERREKKHYVTIGG